MKSFIGFLTEKSEAPGIQHIEHPADRIFDGKDAAKQAISTVSGAASGKGQITRKLDDRMSFQTIRTEDGKVGVKYKGAGAHYNFSETDIDKQHGNKPYLAGSGDFKVRIGTRSEFYEVQAEIKIKKMPDSAYSLKPGTKKKNPFLK